MSEPLPCPFCGANLIPPLVPERGKQYHHPENGCYLTGQWIEKVHLEKWNTRAAQRPEEP